jgi:hypothetical protein
MTVSAKLLQRVVIILGIVLLAWSLRMRAVVLLPVDYDEDDYLRAAQLYAKIIRNRTWQQLPDVTFNSEHPPLAKLTFGAALASLPPAPEIPEHSVTDPAASSLPRLHLTRARTVSAIFGTLEVLLLVLLNPLAGLLLASHTFTIKYTSYVMLEALPAFTSAVAVVAYERSQVYNGKGWNRWLALSAIALGLTISSKYVYGIAGVVILAHWLLTAGAGIICNPRSGLQMGLRMAGWCTLGLLVFLATNPYLWSSPLERLQGSVSYHLEFSRSFLVQVMNLPFFMPIVWLFMWAPGHPDVMPIGPDPLIAVLAVLGFKSLWRTRPLYAIWIVTALVFLFLWPTKWPQYVLILTFPWALAAAQGLENTGPRVRRGLRRMFASQLHCSGGDRGVVLNG